MALLRGLVVIHTTSNASDSQTDDNFRLHIADSAGNRITFDFPDIPHDERESGRTDEYSFDLSNVSPPLDSETLKPDDIRIETLGKDAWLPSSMWVIGLPINGSPILIAGTAFWPNTLWFSTETSDADGHALPERSINEGLEVPL